MVVLDLRRSNWRRIFSRLILFSGFLLFAYTFVILGFVVNSSKYESPIIVSDERQPCPDAISDKVELSHATRMYSSSSSSRGRPGTKVTSVNCLALMEGSQAELNRASLYMSFNPYRPVTPAELSKQTKDCDAFVWNRGYNLTSVTEEEKEFPLAFSILVHRDVDQLERLIRSIYRYHNSYCIHVDANSSAEILRAVNDIVKCLPNVYVPPKMESITYAHFSRLQADLSCMRELLVRGGKWKYLINLTGQMFPLKTNLEMVKILETYEDTNDIEAFSRYVSSSMKIRYQFKYSIIKERLINTRRPKELPPHNITLVKGSAYGAYTHAFIQYIFQNPLVQEFLNWTRDIYSPDEFFWASLNSRWVNPMFSSPGGHDLPPERKPWMATYAAWKKKDNCGGKFVRDVCIFGLSDLPSLIGRRELFANKFYADFQYLTLDCLEEWLFNKTKHLTPIDLEYYRNIRRQLRST